MVSASSVTLKQGDTDLLFIMCKQLKEIDYDAVGTELGCNKNASYLRWRRFKERNFGDKKNGVALKQPDVDLLFIMCKQLKEIDYAAVGTELGCNKNAAYLRWRRFRERNFGDKKGGEQAQIGGENEGEVKTSKKGTKSGGGRKAGAKRRMVDVEDGESENQAIPTKKIANTKGVRGKMGAQLDKSEEDEYGFGENEDRFEVGLEREMASEEQGMEEL